MDWELEEMGRANGWPCVVSSIWREPGFCPDYASDSCPFYYGEDRPCRCQDSPDEMDLMPFLFFD